MDRGRIIADLQDFVVEQLLSGDGRDFDSRTPLLDLGIIDSLTILQLSDFIQTRFGVKLRPESMSPQHLRDLESLGDVVMAERNGLKT